MLIRVQVMRQVTDLLLPYNAATSPSISHHRFNVLQHMISQLYKLTGYTPTLGIQPNVGTNYNHLSSVDIADIPTGDVDVAMMIPPSTPVITNNAATWFRQYGGGGLADNVNALSSAIQVDGGGYTVLDRAGLIYAIMADVLVQSITGDYLVCDIHRYMFDNNIGNGPSPLTNN
jgi:hypothetical protein